jgi:hypothetical protein
MFSRRYCTKNFTFPFSGGDVGSGGGVGAGAGVPPPSPSARGGVGRVARGTDATGGILSSHLMFLMRYASILLQELEFDLWPRWGDGGADFIGIFLVDGCRME